jgi:transcriptional regulator with XRE-family HTH domain
MAQTNYVPVGPPNPIRRLRRAKRLSQDQLASFTDTTRLTVLRAEQGLFEEVPQRLADVLLDLTPLNYDPITKHPVAFYSRSDTERILELNAEYREFQGAQRAFNGLNGNGLLTHPFVLGPGGNTHVFKQLRVKSGLSQIGFCIRFCVNPGGLYKWESFKQQHAPKQLLDSLLEAGYPEASVNHLVAQADREWRARFGRST